MQGQLFTQDFLLHGIRESVPYRAFSDDALQSFHQQLQHIFQGLTATSTLNEAQTE